MGESSTNAGRRFSKQITQASKFHNFWGRERASPHAAIVPKKEQNAPTGQALNHSSVIVKQLFPFPSQVWAFLQLIALAITYGKYRSRLWNVGWKWLFITISCKEHFGLKRPEYCSGFGECKCSWEQLSSGDWSARVFSHKELWFISKWRELEDQGWENKKP